MQDFSLNPVEMLVIFSLFHALLLAGLLFLKHENRQANIFLSVLLLGLAFSNAIFLVLVFGFYNRFPWLHWLPYGLSFIMGPAFFFYVKSLVSPMFTFQKKDVVHFLPIILNYPHSIYHLIYGRNIYHETLHYFLDNLSYFAIIPTGVYLFFSYQLILRYQKGMVEEQSNTDHRTLKWLRQFILIITLSFVVALIIGLINLTIKNLSFEEEYIGYLSFTFSIFWLGFGGLLQSQAIFDLERFDQSEKEVSGIPTVLVRQRAERLQTLMEQEKLYLNPNLNVRMLEERLNLTAKEISTALNQSIGQNFYQFINAYRVEEVKKRLVNREYNHLTVNGIAQDSGFNSKATFNRIFKSTTGMTPREYQLRLRNNG